MSGNDIEETVELREVDITQARLCAVAMGHLADTLEVWGHVISQALCLGAADYILALSDEVECLRREVDQ